MKKTIVIFLTLLIVVTSSPLQQGVELIIKTGSFVHHFLHHIKCQNDKIGLNDFVHLHYFDDVHLEQDHEEHEGLPFSHHHSPKTLSINFTLFFTALKMPSFYTLELTNRQNFFYQEFIPSSLISNIWKPPRF